MIRQLININKDQEHRVLLCFLIQFQWVVFRVYGCLKNSPTVNIIHLQQYVIRSIFNIYSGIGLVSLTSFYGNRRLLI